MYSFLKIFGILFVSRNFAENDDVVELICTVEVPKDTVNRVCNYKYCVISDANEVMKSPFEFFTGSTTGSGTHEGGIINRFLRLSHSKLEKGSKCTYVYRTVQKLIL